jgi:polar amino acid transport system permease protein
VATLSTLVFVGLIVLVVVNAPGWPDVKQAFFDPDVFRESFPDIARAFLINVRIFLIAEVFILVFALVIALLRGLQGPVFFPLRALATIYSDFFRGLPTILLVYILGFGITALQLPGVPVSPLFWGTVALVLVYSAYVSEVYRAGIESVHPSQEAAARSLGLSRFTALRYVVLPQAVRRVVPPLLNDFIGLQKDTALVALLGVVEAFRQSQIDVAGSFNYDGDGTGSEQHSQLPAGVRGAGWAAFTAVPGYDEHDLWWGSDLGWDSAGMDGGILWRRHFFLAFTVH